MLRSLYEGWMTTPESLSNLLHRAAVSGISESGYCSAREHSFCHRSEIKLLPETRHIVTITTTGVW
jgi:hypothetical protein